MAETQAAVRLELNQEKRDHEETRRQLASANQMIEGFERTVKALAAEIDRKTELLDSAVRVIDQAAALYEKLSGKTEEVDQ